MNTTNDMTEQGKGGVDEIKVRASVSKAFGEPNPADGMSFWYYHDVPYLLAALSAAQGECERYLEKDGQRTREHNLLVKENREQQQRIAELERTLKSLGYTTGGNPL